MRCTAIPPLLLALAACSGAPAGDAAGDPFAADPLVAAALHDPLMSDPDLAARNEANAVLGFAGDTALPLLPATPEAAQAAREAGRLELLAEGTIPPLPAPVTGPGPLAGQRAGVQGWIAALGAPADCAAVLSEDFGWAARLPQAASIMPQGMVVQAGGAETAPCGLRIIRYHTPAAPEDVLQYHYVRAGRAGMRPLRHGEGGETIAGRAESGEALIVSARKAASGMTAVELYYRAR